MKWCGFGGCFVLFACQSMSLSSRRRNLTIGRTWLEQSFTARIQKESFCMKQAIDLARRFLALANRDVKTLRLLISAADSDDQAIGFHAQQAIEKYLKAVRRFTRRFKSLCGDSAL
jgi:hypothetical protein